MEGRTGLAGGMGKGRIILTMALLGAGLGGCVAAGTELPPPRGLIVRSGERLSTSAERMEEVDLWVRAEIRNIQEDPSFFVNWEFKERPAYVWEELKITGDTVTFLIEDGAADVSTPYQIYAHIHLMRTMDRLDEWLPETPDLDGYALERAALARMSDVWLYGRTISDTAPYPILDELLFAAENGFLDAYIFTARPDEFAEEREAWLGENPNGVEEYSAWFDRVFRRLPPGLREEERATEEAEEEKPIPPSF